jgi:hypothetical protein
MAAKKRRVADEDRNYNDWSSILFTGSVDTARFVLSVREAFLQLKSISGAITTANMKEHGK